MTTNKIKQLQDEACNTEEDSAMRQIVKEAALAGAELFRERMDYSTVHIDIKVSESDALDTLKKMWLKEVTEGLVKNFQDHSDKMLEDVIAGIRNV